MPLHISEIGVRMAVREPGDNSAVEGPARPGATGGCGDDKSGLSRAQQKSIVDECVQSVLQALRMREAR